MKKVLLTTLLVGIISCMAIESASPLLTVGVSASNSAGKSSVQPFATDDDNLNFTAQNEALYSEDGKTLLRCPTGMEQIVVQSGTETIADGAFAGSTARCIILPEGLKRVSSGAFANMAANGTVAVVVPESAVVEPPAFSPSDGTCLCLFSTENGMPACTFIGGGSFAAVEAPVVWALLDYLTPEEVYGGITEPAYGFKQLLTRDGLSSSWQQSVYFLTEEGFAADCWVCDGGKVYYLSGGRSPALRKSDGHYTYTAAGGSQKEADFTFNDLHAVSSELPADMMVVTKASLTPVPLSEAMQTGETAPHYTLRYQNDKAYIYDENGTMMKSGWYQADGDWFYLNDYGAGVVKCWRYGTDGKYRYLKADGRMARNEWVQDYGNWYYVGSDGKKYTGAHTIAGVDYLFDSNGILQEDQTEVPEGTVPVTVYNCTTSEPVAMTVRFTESDGEIYCMADGRPVSDRWVKADGSWYLTDDDGKLFRDTWVWSAFHWEQYWYRFDASGKMLADQWFYEDGITYYLMKSGGMASNDWVQADGKWYYFLQNGSLARDQWVLTGSYWYYVGADGVMLTDTTTPYGYYVDGDGIWRK